MEEKCVHCGRLWFLEEDKSFVRPARRRLLTLWRAREG